MISRKHDAYGIFYGSCIMMASAAEAAAKIMAEIMTAAMNSRRKLRCVPRREIFSRA